MNRTDLRLRIRERADMVDSLFVTDTEINGLIDTSVADLYDFLVSEYGDEKFARGAWIVVRGDWEESLPGLGPDVTDPDIAWPVNAQGYYPALGTNGEIQLVNRPSPSEGVATGFTLPADFLRMVRVHYTAGTVERVNALLDGTLTVVTPEWRIVSTDKVFWPMHTIEMTGQIIDTKPRVWNQSRVAYRLVHGPHQIATGHPLDAQVSWTNSAVIQFLPVPIGRYAVQIFYVPKPRLLTDDTEHLAYDFPDYVIFDCAAECLEKQDSDAARMRARLDRVKDRIRNNARTLDAGQVPQVVDVYGSNRLERGSLSDSWEE